MAHSHHFRLRYICLFWSLLPLLSAISATTICNGCLDPYRFDYPGVGFHLALDYGTSAVYLPDGSTCSVSKIEGSDRYKGLMRRITSEDQSMGRSARANPLSKSWWSTLNKACNSNRWLSKAPAIQSILQSLTANRKTLDDIALVEILLSLRVSTESFLGTPLNTTEIVVPIPIHDEGRILLDRALVAANLHSAIPSSGFYTFAAKEAARANGIGKCLEYIGGDGREEMKPQLVLIVDYSRAALTMILAVEEEGCLEYFRQEHRLDLGAAQRADEEHWTAIEGLVNDMKAAPADVISRYPSVPSKVSQVVLLGDRVTDDKMINLLEEVMGIDVMVKTQYEASSGSREGIDPVFSAVMSAAAISKGRIDAGGWEDCMVSGHCK